MLERISFMFFMILGGLVAGIAAAMQWAEYLQGIF